MNIYIEAFPINYNINLRSHRHASTHIKHEKNVVQLIDTSIKQGTVFLFKQPFNNYDISFLTDI